MKWKNEILVVQLWGFGMGVSKNDGPFPVDVSDTCSHVWGAALKLDKYTDHYRAGLMLDCWLEPWFSQNMTRRFYAAAMDSR